VLALVALVGCGGSDTDTTDTADTTDTTDTNGGTQGQNVNPLSTPPTGSLTCFTPETSYDASTWLTQELAAIAQPTKSLVGTATDFEEETPEDNREITLWFDDVVDGTPDFFQEVGDDGTVTFEAPVCQPISYLAAPVPGLEDAKPTYKVHQIYGPTTTEAEFISVSSDSYNVIPAILGITPDPTKSIIAGTAFDCTRSPDTLSDIDDGKMENVQIRVSNLDGSVPEGVAVRYFIENFPDRDQPDTSPDGLFVAINVPPGDMRVEMWGLVDGEEKILGTSTIKSEANSINITNLFAGFDSVKYPDSCVSP
jgi:hypothetical protein